MILIKKPAELLSNKSKKGNSKMDVHNIEQLYTAVSNDEPVIRLKDEAKTIVTDNMSIEYHQFRQYRYFKRKDGLDFGDDSLGMNVFCGIVSVVDQVISAVGERKLTKGEKEKQANREKIINKSLDLIDKYYFISFEGNSYIEIKHDGEWSISAS